MARIEGFAKPRSLFARVVFWMVKRRLGRVPLPVRILALHPRVFGGYARMELGLDKAKLVPITVKELAQVRVATLIGCPF